MAPARIGRGAIVAAALAAWAWFQPETRTFAGHRVGIHGSGAPSVTGSSEPRRRSVGRLGPRRQTRQARGGDAIGEWRAGRRERLLGSYDWTRYHLWVYFVDANEPTYAQARLARYFFERVNAARMTSGLLYTAAGGLIPPMREEEDMEVTVAVPGLHAEDLQNLLTPAYQFDPADVHMYDVVVASDENTLERIRDVLREAGVEPELDQLCVITDFLDAYDALLRKEQITGFEPVEEPGLRPGFLTKESLMNLQPGKPMRGTPPPCPVGDALEGLPESWVSLWDDVGADMEIWTMKVDGEDLPPNLVAGRILRSVVGLQRSLYESIPKDMRWWNDEE